MKRLEESCVGCHMGGHSKWVFSNLNIYECGQLVDMCDSATHLGHFISSPDKKSIVKSAKSCFWRSFNICMSDFGQVSYTVKCKLFNQYCCSFYGSPMWTLKSTIVESMCGEKRWGHSGVLTP